MPEIGMSISMSGDGKRGVAAWPKLPRPSSTLPILNRSPAHSGSGDLYWSRRSQINLFCNSQGIVNLYSKIPHCAFQPIACRQ
jgi:hypothetical protein